MRFHREVVHILNANGTERGSATAALWATIAWDGAERWGGTVHLPFLNSAQVVPTEVGTRVRLRFPDGQGGWAMITRYDGGVRQRARFKGDDKAPF